MDGKLSGMAALHAAVSTSAPTYHMEKPEPRYTITLLLSLILLAILFGEIVSRIPV